MNQMIESIRAFFANFFVERSEFGISITDPGFFMPVFVLLLSTAFIIILKDRIRNWKYEHYLRNALGITVFLLVPAFSWANIFSYGGSITTDLPFQLCSFAMLFSGLMMIKKNDLFFQIAFFMGMIGGISVLFIPNWNIDPTCFRYYQYYGGHTLIILNSLYMIFVHRKRIGVKSYFIALLTTITIGLLTYPVNTLLETNYFYSHHGPSEIGISHLVYPVYFFVWVGGIAFIYGILLLPWILHSRFKKDKNPA